MSYKRGTKRLATIALSAGLIVPIMQPAIANAQGSTVDVKLLSFNDLHGQYDADAKYGGGIDNLSAYLKKLQSENKNTLTMSAGDAVGGSPAVAALKQDQPTLEILKEMNVDIVTTGNHEYDEGITELARLVQGGKHASGLDWAGSEGLGWITSNVVANKDLQFGNKTIKKGDPILNPYTVKEFDGVKVGVIGVVTTDTAKKVVPNGIKDVDFIDEVQAIDKYTEELKSQGVKTIVVLSHVPAKTDKDTGKLIDLSEESDIYDISQKVNGEVDVIIAADNHDYANSVVKREGKDDIVVTEAYSKGQNIGEIDLTIDKTTGDVVNSKANIISVDPKKITADAKVTNIVQKAAEDVKPMLERKVGYAEEEIPRTIDNDHGEAELGRMIAEAQLWAVRDKGENIDISLMNIGGVRSELKAGDVTYEDVYTIQPFSNDLTKLTLTGAQLKEILEKQEIHDWIVGQEEGKYNRPRMLQIDGFTYKWHPEKKDGKWVVKVDSINLKDEKKTEVKADTKINAVVNIFLAQGGDGFDTFKESKYEVVMGDLEAFEKYTEKFSKEDRNGNGTLGLNKIDINKNPNIINTYAVNTNKLVGSSRYETAVKISESAFKKADNVIIVNSQGDADALAATPFAKLKDAPILLTGSKTLDANTKAEITRLGAKNAYIIGGDTRVEESVSKELKSMNLNVERISGKDRYETALQVAKKLGDVSEVAVVNGQKGLADAVSVAPVAASKNMPILFSSPTEGTKVSDSYIKDEKVTKSYVIGQEASISKEVAAKLPNAERIGGKDRNETNAMVIEKFYTNEELNNIYVAKNGIKNNTDLVDALAVGAVAAKVDAPVVIGSDNLNEKQVQVLSTKKTKMLTQVGGNGNEGIFAKIKSILKK
ncbi:cell wall-binding repeat-containing protein [Romboutsia lituseburensis]|uniref:2',3'-cyclic-nucleotide 2'-phosphodiesterase/5'-or 3'-nucleotidase, 5'-nucleotidase family n=1 Tax=Romboutsia lituseburensis DSM 797 TaxID=1121325 RepID=A0A1G9ML25_9FIRM|nr:cell wall-binding repeat-containing protein [Romboutsia lituseburensis]CEH34428.1 Endonuclease YhcR [Romboutsia lituseburensis]SDL74355.1 2',3'-cyclic-nucleotide 2'-phosphodiesterase/5'-or 3'-nucleotidase, 5'-nucleotidase family [Romboutsia lituseburensis DSM 797]